MLKKGEVPLRKSLGNKELTDYLITVELLRLKKQPTKRCMRDLIVLLEIVTKEKAVKNK
jgi:hypothetical protein